jgi:hypothetical protein
MQYFIYQYGDEKLIFATTLNGEGYYSADNNTILGSIHDQYGYRMCTARINYSMLIPMQYSQVKAIFKDFKL